MPGITGAESLARCIAIDGPTASGKTAVGQALAESLRVGFFDTGLMYRACTLAVMRAGTAIEDERAVTELICSLPLDMRWPDPTEPHVYLGDEDVTPLLRTQEIEAKVSLVSRIEDVRAELVRRQRELASREPVVMAGRDIGTRVLKEARTKIFLDASSAVRAQRRQAEEREAGRNSTFDEVLVATRRRDELDNTGHRAIHPEQRADGALLVETDALGIDEVVARCIEAYRRQNPGA